MVKIICLFDFGQKLVTEFNLTYHSKHFIAGIILDTLKWSIPCLTFFLCTRVSGKNDREQLTWLAWR